MSRRLLPSARLLVLLLPLTACLCADVPVTRVEVALVVTPFDEACVLPALTKVGITPLTEPFRDQADGMRVVKARVPGLPEASNIRGTTDAGEKGSPVASTSVTWVPLEAEKGTMGRVALDYRYMFGWGAPTGPAEVERSFTGLLDALAGECGWTVGARTCTRIEEETEGRTLECLTLPAIFNPPPPPGNATVHELAPPEGLAPHVLEAIAKGIELETVPDGTLPGPPKPEQPDAPPPLPADYIPPPAYSDDLYQGQE